MKFMLICNNPSLNSYSIIGNKTQKYKAYKCFHLSFETGVYR